MHDLLLGLTDQALATAYDSGTLRRARGYVRDGRVLSVEVEEAAGSRVRLVGEVEGTSFAPYDVVALVQHGRLHPAATSTCSCPVGRSCKHGAAVLLHARARTEPATGPTWGSHLDVLLDELDHGSAPAAGTRAAALQFDLQPPGRRRSWEPGPAQPRIRVRPVQEGARGNWVKTSFGWAEVGYAGHRQEHDPAQIAVLAQLAASLNGGVFYGQTLPELGDFGVGLWPLLRRARETGIPFVTTGGLAGVELVEEPLRFQLDLTTAATGETRVAPGVGHAGEWWPAEKLIVLGPEGHGVAMLRPEPIQGKQQLTLAPLERFFSGAVRQRLVGAAALAVPAEEWPAFTADYLPRLRRHLEVASSDGSVAIPEDVPPALVLTVDWRAVEAIHLSWSWRYAVGEERRDYPLGSTEGLVAVRRVQAEREHLAGLDLAGLDEAATRLLADDRGALRPDHTLSDADLLTFVERVLPALRDSGLVEVEEVADAPSYRLATGAPEIRFEAPDPGDDDGDEEERTDWLDLDVVVEVDGESVPLATVLEALTLEREWIILPSGLHLRTDHPRLARLADLVRAAGELVEQERDRVRIGEHDLGLWAELAELGVVDAQAEQWVRAARALAELRDLPEVDPTGLSCELRGYQRDGFRWLALLWRAGLGGILADDMGLGKTLQTLALIGHARGDGAGPFLVVAPTSVVPNWVHEAANHAPDLDVRAIAATGKRLGMPLAEAVAGADVVVTSYTVFRREVEELAALPWGGLVLDEAQQVKNHQSKTYQAVRRLDVPFRVALTGTPFENRLMELWSLLSVVAPGLYPSPKKFADHVAHPVERQRDARALERFRRRIRPFLLRRTKELVAADLPPKQEQVLEVTLGARHRKVYDTHLQRERQAVLGLVEDFDRNRVAIFRSLTRLRQLSLDAALVDEEYCGVGSAKLDLLVEHLVELTREGHRALVFSQFTSFLARVRDRLDAEGIAASYLDGRTRRRGEVIDGFRQGSDPVFLISLKAGGTGLTLTEADYVFVLDPWWNPAVEAQAVDRAHRIGQQRPVMVYRLVATDTIEEKVMALKERKADLFAQVVDGDGAMAGGIGAEDVRALFGE